LLSESAWDSCKDSVPADFEIIHSAVKNSLGAFEIAEVSDGPFGVLQMFSSSLGDRASRYMEFKFLTPEEKVQQELKEKLAQLQQANSQLKSKLETTEQQVVKARDRAMELHKFLEQSRNEMRNTIGEQVQAAMAEVASLIAESQSLEDKLTHTRKQMDGSKEVMQQMKEKLKTITEKNSALRLEVVEAIREQERLMAENARLLEILERKPKGFIKRLLHKPARQVTKKHLKEGDHGAAPLEAQRSLEIKRKTSEKLSLSSGSVTPPKLEEGDMKPPKLGKESRRKSEKQLSAKSKSETKVFNEIRLETSQSIKDASAATTTAKESVKEPSPRKHHKSKKSKKHTGSRIGDAPSKSTSKKNLEIPEVVVDQASSSEKKLSPK